MAAMVEVVLILFLVVVAPIWLVLHYRSRRGLAPSGEPAGEGEVENLWQTARGMEERIRTLERILDADAPSWRGRSGARDSHH